MTLLIARPTNFIICFLLWVIFAAPQKNQPLILFQNQISDYVTQ